MYCLLLIGIAILLVVSIQIFDKEVLSPPVIVLVMFLMSGTLGLLRYKVWRIGEYGSKACLLLLLALIAFLVGSFIGARTTPTNAMKKAACPIRRDRIDLPDILLLCLLFGFFVTNIGFYIVIRKIVASLGFGYSSISETINNYRIISTHYQNQYSFPTLLKLFGYICTSAGTIGVFVLVHNLAFRQKRKKDILYLAMVVMWITVLLQQSNRSGLLFVLAEGVYFFYFFLNMYYGWRFQVDKKIIKWGAGVFIVFIIVFVGLAVGLGRFSNSGKLDILDYVTVYISSGIRNFDLFVKKPPEIRGFGIETFPSVYRNLYNRFGLFKTAPNAWLEFRYIDGLKISNIYTCFRRYYSDFGSTGIVGLPFIMGVLFTISYQIIKRSSFVGQIHLRMLLFAYLSRALFYMPIDDTLFEFEVSINGIFKIAVLLILFILLDNHCKIHNCAHHNKISEEIIKIA